MPASGRRAIAAASLIGFAIGLAATPALAATADPIANPAADPASAADQEIVVLGTRRSGVGQLDAPAPVDVITSEAIAGPNSRSMAASSIR